MTRVSSRQYTFLNNPPRGRGSFSSSYIYFSLSTDLIRKLIFVPSEEKKSQRNQSRRVDL